MIPFFLKKKEEGILPVTDLQMMRFWINLEQGVDFVFKCLEIMVGAELFVPKDTEHEYDGPYKGYCTQTQNGNYQDQAP